MAPPPSDPSSDPAAAQMQRLEARLARIEAYLRLDESAAAPKASPASVEQREEELEFKVGQEWFAKVGIAALGFGAAFTLSQPYAGLASALPSLAGFALAGAIYALAAFFTRRLEVVCAPLIATAMGLCWFSGLRLCYLGAEHALAADSLAGAGVLTLCAALNLVVALRKGSPWLSGFALVTGYATAVAVGEPAYALALIALLSVAAAAAGVARHKPVMVLTAMPLAYAAYAAWALNNPFLGRPVQWFAPAPWGPLALLVSLAAFSLGLLLSTPDREDMVANAGIFLTTCLGSLIYLMHALQSYEGRFVEAQAVASVSLLALAFVHARRKDPIGSFVCAMAGFLLLSFAIMKATRAPEMFVWLSVQSVIVVATAIWLRSRFVVVANFVIFVGILAGYVASVEQERGVSLGFGVVAMVTARLLAWKQERLELKTMLMRNAYLAVAFVVFPYALYHLVPPAWVGLAWVGAALLYYLVAAVLHNSKYRWMGHATLLLTAVYMAVAGLSRLEPLLRTLSLVVLGVVLLVVSLIFTRLRSRRKVP